MKIWREVEGKLIVNEKNKAHYEQMIRYAHTNIISKDWWKLADFYVEVFDCKIIPPIRNQSGGWLDKGTGLKNAELTGAHLLLPGYGDHGPTLEIYQYTNMQPQAEVWPNQRGFGHIAFEVDNVEATLEKVESSGGKRFGAITRRRIIEVGEITFVYARDPEGNLIELQSWNKG